ncbi:hypothetical protein Scep_006249 [Stephania cephalantha]|uniref:Uncharacterized protein n=1 Tax=Stephania cephalantha TaxID=152367 RepID=A0AAP0K7V0_9MAGN
MKFDDEMEIHMENINKPLKLRPPNSLNAAMEGTGVGHTYVLGNFIYKDLKSGQTEIKAIAAPQMGEFSVFA